jgi:hypothetical protein
MRLFTREAVNTLPAEPTARALTPVAPDALPRARQRWRVPKVRPSSFIFVVGVLAALQALAPENIKPSALIGSVSGSIQSAMMQASMVSDLPPGSSLVHNESPWG